MTKLDATHAYATRLNDQVLKLREDYEIAFFKYQELYYIHRKGAPKNRFFSPDEEDNDWFDKDKCNATHFSSSEQAVYFLDQYLIEKIHAKEKAIMLDIGNIKINRDLI